MAPKLAALDENNDAVRAQLLKRAKPSRRPGLVVGDIVKIARPHTAGRRIKDAQFGGQAYPVQEISYEGGVKRYRVNERLYFRHDLLKITDVENPGRGRSAAGAAHLPGHAAAVQPERQPSFASGATVWRGRRHPTASAATRRWQRAAGR